jgi:chromosome segregation ATPase
MRTTTVLLCVVLLGGLMLAQSPTPVPFVSGGDPTYKAIKEPTLTLTQLENRLTELQKAEAQAEQKAAQAQANVHAFQGAIAETENWIKQLEESAIPKAPAPVNK